MNKFTPKTPSPKSYSPFLFCQIVLLTLIIKSGCFAQIIITEIMRDPIGSETQLIGGAALEFIELTNCGTDTFDITHCFISDGIEADSIIVMSDTLPCHTNCLYGHRFLLPGQTALILDPDYRKIPSSQGCKLNIKDSTVLWECGDSDLGNGLASNDGVFVYRGTRNSIDSIIAAAYDGEDIPPSPKSGKLTLTVENPLEGISVVPKNCLVEPLQYTNGGSDPSPGWYEHLSNGWIIEYMFAPGPYTHNELPCTVVIKNVQPARQSSSQWSISYGSPPTLKTLTHGTITPTQSFSRFSVTIPLDTNRYFVNIDNSKREIDRSSVWTPALSLRINELFPKSTSVEPEWIEIVNRSSISINLKDWYFGYGTDTLKICTSDLIIKKGMFCVITDNKKLFLQKYDQVPYCIQPQQWYTINNHRDSLSLFSPSRNPVDTVSYDASNFDNWTTQSLERIDATKSGITPNAWAPSISSTPCRQNSVVGWRNTDVIKIDVGPHPFTPNGDGKNDLFMIGCNVPATKKVIITIVTFDGRTVKTFDEPLGPKYFWDGLDNRGTPVENGPFFVIVSISENGKYNVIRKKGILWR